MGVVEQPIADRVGDRGIADERIHETTHEAPRLRFEQRERAALQPLPALPLPQREQVLERRVAHDALIDVDTVRHSVPHALVRDRVEVRVGLDEVRIFRGTELVALHARCREPYGRVVDPAHDAELWRQEVPEVAEVEPIASPLAAMGRSLEEYATLIEGAAS